MINYNRNKCVLLGYSHLNQTAKERKPNEIAVNA